MKALTRNQIETTPEFPLRILQFGGGNFLRAFTGWMVEVLNEETSFGGNIAVVKPTKQGSYSKLKRQDGLYHVLLWGIKDGGEFTEIKRIHCIREIVNPYTAWDTYLKLAEIESIRFVVSNTTEAGIRFDPNAENSGKVPSGFPAKLTLWLYHRYRFFKGDKSAGCYILPCELIEDNGTQLYSCILKHAKNWGFEDGFTDWLKTSNYFCNTLVDRIVSGFPHKIAYEFYNQTGFCDELLVAGEYYHSWVIEGPEMLRDELPVENTPMNVQFVEDLEPYREMKVRILNASHSIMVPIGCLMGLNFVHECMEEKLLTQFLRRMITEEICPTLELPSKDVMAFAEATLSRFQNPRLNHRLMSIALNSMTKFNTRVIPVFLAYYHNFGKLPVCIVLALAAQICFYRHAEDKGIPDSPETIAFIRSIWNAYDQTEKGAGKVVSGILSGPNLWAAELVRVPGLHQALGSFVFRIASEGIIPVLRSTEAG